MKKKTGSHIKRIRGVFFFDPGDRIYEGHFPERPVVPGSVILHAFLDILEQNGLLSEKIGIEKFRFHDFVTPGRRPFSVTIEDRQVTCVLYNEEKTAAEGKFVI